MFGQASLVFEPEVVCSLSVPGKRGHRHQRLPVPLQNTCTPVAPFRHSKEPDLVRSELRKCKVTPIPMPGQCNKREPGLELLRAQINDRFVNHLAVLDSHPLRLVDGDGPSQAQRKLFPSVLATVNGNRLRLDGDALRAAVERSTCSPAQTPSQALRWVATLPTRPVTKA